jgi:hypothetical protein
MRVKKHRKSTESVRDGLVVCIGLILVLVQLIVVPCSSAQRHNKRRRVNKIEKRVLTDNADPFERTVRTICEQRKRDSMATIPIDEMASMRPLPLTDRRVLAGKSRAQRLLPIAKRLVPFALRQVAAKNGLEPVSSSWIIDRVQAVNFIKAEVEERDNSSWRPSEPDAIIFGTIFLSGLRSDEAMIAVLAHELTHAINSTDQGLQPLFIRIGANASRTREPVSASAAIELGCELVGIEVLRDYISKTGGRGKTGLRLARDLEKDCVQRDLPDENHLSPRETMLLLLKLDPELASGISGKTQARRLTRHNR